MEWLFITFVTLTSCKFSKVQGTRNSFHSWLATVWSSAVQCWNLTALCKRKFNTNPKYQAIPTPKPGPQNALWFFPSVSSAISPCCRDQVKGSAGRAAWHLSLDVVEFEQIINSFRFIDPWGQLFNFYLFRRWSCSMSYHIPVVPCQHQGSWCMCVCAWKTMYWQHDDHSIPKTYGAFFIMPRDLESKSLSKFLQSGPCTTSSAWP